MTSFRDLVSHASCNIWLDLSTYCNASCPQCHRTDQNGLGKVDWLPLIKWSLEDFVKKFPPGSIDMVERFELCGTWGDPIMSKDVGKICKYIVDNSNATVHINTNGGMRTPAWWEDLGNYCGNRLHVYFDIDGITNEMHQKYRRGVDLQIVLDNMEALSSTEARTEAFIILFKHNEKYVYDIQNLAKMYGAQSTYVIKSDRFLSNSRWDFINEKGEPEYLEEVEGNVNHIIENPWIDTASKNMMKRIGKVDKSEKWAMRSQNDR
tara:strand:+ start:685 stop:1476 length:792 start_codon:yes stop_codon:yes gene_type:complete